MSQDSNMTYKSKDIDDTEDFNLSIVLENVKRNKIIISSFTLLTFLLSILYVIFKSPLYEGTFQILLSKKQDSSSKAIESAKTTLLEGNPQLSNIFGTYDNSPIQILTEVEILKSPLVLMPVFNNFKKRKLSEGIDLSNLDFIDWRDSFLKIERENKTSILNISYFGKDKKIIIDILKDISNEYQKYSTIDRTKHIEQGLKFLDNQINIYKNQSAKSYKRIYTFAIKNDLQGLDFLQEKGTKINLYEDRRTFYANRKRFLNEMLNYFKSIENNEDKLLTFSKITPNKYSAKIEELDTVYALLKSNFKESDIQLIKNRKERKTYIDLLKVALVEYYEKELKENEFRYNATKRPKEILAEYNELIIKAKRDNNTLTNLLRERRLFSFEKAKVNKPWKLISYPYVKNNPVKPVKNKVIILGIFSGLIFGYIFAFIKDLQSSKIFAKEEMRELLNNKELLFLSKEKSSIWKELLNLSFSNFEDYSKERDISLIKLGDIDQNNLKMLKEVIQKKFPNIKINIYNNFFDCKESKNKLFISQLSRTTKKELAIFEEQRFLLKLENINWILFDS